MTETSLTVYFANGESVHIRGSDAAFVQMTRSFVQRLSAIARNRPLPELDTLLASEMGHLRRAVSLSGANEELFALLKYLLDGDLEGDLEGEARRRGEALTGHL